MFALQETVVAIAVANNSKFNSKESAKLEKLQHSALETPMCWSFVGVLVSL